MKVNFYLHNDLDTTGRAAIYLRYSHDSEEFRTSVKYLNDGGIIRIKPDSWIKSHKHLQGQIKSRKASRKDSPFRVKIEHPLAKIINSRLDDIEKEIYKICGELLSNGKTPFISDVKNVYQSRNKKIDIWSIWERFMHFKKQVSKERTIRNYRSFENDLLKFNENHKININRLDGDFLLAFRQYLANRGNSLSSIKVKFDRFLSFLNWALDNDLISNDKFKKWRIENETAIHTALTPNEIKRIIDYPHEKNLQFVKDILLFSCFTGLRRGEMEGLTSLSENKGILTFETGKVKGETRLLRSVKLNSLSKPIWERLKQDRIVITSKKVYQMKQVVKLAGVSDLVHTSKGQKEKWKDISTNTGRRTFITLSYQFGIPENFISLIVGHKGKGMTAHYDKTQISKSYAYMNTWEKAFFQAIA